MITNIKTKFSFELSPLKNNEHILGKVLVMFNLITVNIKETIAYTH